MVRRLCCFMNVICAIVWVMPAGGYAQDNQPFELTPETLADQAGAELRSIYPDIPQFGGPSSVGGQIAEDAAVAPQWRLQGLQDHFEPWYRFKERLNDCHGLQFNIDESMFYQVATDSLGETNAASGLVRVYGQWEPLSGA